MATWALTYLKFDGENPSTLRSQDVFWRHIDWKRKSPRGQGDIFTGGVAPHPLQAKLSEEGPIRAPDLHWSDLSLRHLRKRASLRRPKHNLLHPQFPKQRENLDLSSFLTRATTSHSRWGAG